MAGRDESRGGEAARLELLALQTLANAVRDGMSLDGTVEYCLEQLLVHLDLDFGCIYLRRHDHLSRAASRGAALPLGPAASVPLNEARWARRPFIAHQSDATARWPNDGGKVWMSMPLRIGSHLAGVMLLGGHRRSVIDLPSLPLAQRLAGPIAVAIDNAARFHQLRGVLDDTRDVIFRTDARGRFTYLNPAWEPLMGEPVVMAIGRRAVSYFLPEHRRRAGHGLSALVPDEHQERRTVPLQTRDGRICWVDLQVRLLRDERDELIGAAGAFRDVSREMRQARELSEAHEKLQERTHQLEHANRELTGIDRLKSEFLATVSHELRTPLSLVMGYTELLLDGVPEAASDGQREYLELIGEGSRRLERLLGQLLELSDLETGAVEVERAPIRLRAVIEEVRRRMEPRATAARVTLAPTQGAELEVLGHREQLTQVLEILLTNAIKFNREGGLVRLRIDPRPDETPGFTPAPDGAPAQFAQVTVQDTGIGITAEQLPLLFQKFRQLDGGETRQHGGLGVGLVIGKALVELMGGRIQLASSGPDRGVSVGFTLPLAQPLDGRLPGQGERRNHAAA